MFGGRRLWQDFAAEHHVAILGVETSYGRITGSHRVLDALYTLGFHYPKLGNPEREAMRGAFFVPWFGFAVSGFGWFRGDTSGMNHCVGASFPGGKRMRVSW